MKILEELEVQEIKSEHLLILTTTMDLITADLVIKIANPLKHLFPEAAKYYQAARFAA